MQISIGKELKSALGLDASSKIGYSVHVRSRLQWLGSGMHNLEGCTMQPHPLRPHLWHGCGLYTAALDPAPASPGSATGQACLTADESCGPQADSLAGISKEKYMV